MLRSIEILDLKSQQKLDLTGLDRLYTRGMNIGDWIKQCRTVAGLNQTQLGEALNVGKANVSAWENNRHEPSYTQMLKIAEVGKHRCPLPGLPAGDWPFENVARERFDQLTDNQRKGIEDWVVRQVDAFLGEAPAKSGDGAKAA